LNQVTRDEWQGEFITHFSSRFTERQGAATLHFPEEQGATSTGTMLMKYMSIYL